MPSVSFECVKLKTQFQLLASLDMFLINGSVQARSYKFVMLCGLKANIRKIVKFLVLFSFIILMMIGDYMR